MSILVVGTVALDTVKTPFGKKKDILGGSATFFSLAARLFSPVNLVAVVGRDFPEKHIRFLKEKGIDLSGLAVEKGKTFRWEGEYGWDFSNPRTLATHLNVLSGFNPQIPEKYKKSDYVFLANIDPRIQMKALREMRKPRVVACDTMNFWIENRRKALLELLKRIDIFFLNESEARQLTGEPNLVRAARGIRKMGPSRIIVKKGEHGSILFSDHSVFCTPAYLLESIFDPTGAGDTFAGGVMGYLATRKKPGRLALREAVVYGNIMATFAVEGFGPGRVGKISRRDISRRFRQFRRITSL